MNLLLRSACVVSALALAGCGSEQSQVDVFAASSLTDAFTEFETQFEASHPNVDIRLNFAGSNVLLRQIRDGAEADIYAPADADLFKDLLSGSQQGPAPFATNRLVAITPVGSSITSIEELLLPGLTLARCASGVPCGTATDEWLTASGATLDRASTETNVRAVLTKVRLGEVDGGFVYRTDALSAASEVRVIELAPSPTVNLAIALLDPGNPAATDFFQFVLSDEAAAHLLKLGFEQP